MSLHSLAKQSLIRGGGTGGGTMMMTNRMMINPSWKKMSRTVIMVPKVGSEKEMEAMAIEQIRSRVQYQKELMKTKAAHHTHEEELKEMWRWINISFVVALPICGLSALYSFFFDVHHHRDDGPLPDYMVIRKKEFPWECSDCDLFDLKCWKKCKAEKIK